MKKNEVVIKEREWSGEASLGSGSDNREESWMSWENRVEREIVPVDRTARDKGLFGKHQKA